MEYTFLNMSDEELLAGADMPLEGGVSLALLTTGYNGELDEAVSVSLADINGAIAMGFFSYGVILFGGLINNGIKGMFHALKDFTLPVSMSFRLFGALLSGALVTELVYYYSLTSYVLPVIVGVLFTLLHALIQAYVLTMLVSIFYGESSEKKEKEEKKKKTKIKKEKRRKVP